MKIAVMEIMQDPQRQAATREPGLLDTPAKRAFDRLARQGGLTSRWNSNPVAHG